MTQGISLVPEDRKRFGLVLIQSIQKNISLANLDQFSTAFSINFNAENQACDVYAKKLSIKAPSLQVMCQQLSGGNQQKVVISKWLMSNPKILIMDDPTRGIDIGAKFEIYKLMNQLSEEGISIIMISSDLEEIIGMCDRIMVMCEGQSMGILARDEFDREKIMEMATGLTKKNHLLKKEKMS
jgi:D-xylose transport system ATP-binding protein